MSMGRWIRRHPFFLLAILAAAGLAAYAALSRSYFTVSPQAVMTEADQLPGISCDYGPFYDSNGYAHLPGEPYTGPAPVYSLPPEAIGVIPPACSFPEVITPTLVTQLGLSYFPVRLEARTPNTWMRVGESTTLEATVAVSESFSGARALNLEAIRWDLFETRQVTFSMAAPNFDFSPDNDEIRPQPLALGRPVQQMWVIAPHSGVAGDQIVNVKLDDPQTSLPVTFAYLRLDVRHPSGVDPVVVTLLAAAGIAVGWVLDRIKTLYEIRKMMAAAPAASAGAPPKIDPPPAE